MENTLQEIYLIENKKFNWFTKIGSNTNSSSNTLSILLSGIVFIWFTCGRSELRAQGCRACNVCVGCGLGWVKIWVYLLIALYCTRFTLCSSSEVATGVKWCDSCKCLICFLSARAHGDNVVTIADRETILAGGGGGGVVWGLKIPLISCQVVIVVNSYRFLSDFATNIIFSLTNNNYLLYLYQ